MGKKKTVLIIGQSEATCNFFNEQLLHFLSEYIEVKIWCLQNDQAPPEHYDLADIYVITNRTVQQKVRSYLPGDKIVLVAARIINIENLGKLLKLEPGSRALVVGTSEESTLMAINIINSLGIRYLELTPYYPGSTVPIPGDITLAITTGLSHLVPPSIQNVVDLGGKGLDLSTFAELIRHLDAPMTVLNDISHYYIEAILNINLQSERIARNNDILKRNMEVILDTVDEAIVAVNGSCEIVVFNPAAERLLDIKSSEAVGQKVQEVIPQVDFSSCLKTGESIIHEIKNIKDTNYIISANPITNQAGAINGVVAIFRQVVEVQELETKVRRALKKKGNIAKHTFAQIIGESDELKRAVSLAKKFAKSELTILLEGESGTGKELFAQSIHNHSHRRNGPFVALNFAALPGNLVESELFGYEDGAFTGAKKGGKPGLFEDAHQGTIFLDEIGDAPLDVQKKLLRVLEEREVRRVGGSTVTPIDVRIIAATNQDLETLTKQGHFRSDLFYRLCSLPIAIPPLRKRKEDIFLLVNYFAHRLFKRTLQMDNSLQEFLYQYKWPGNIRELQNVVQYMCNVVPQHQAASLENLPSYLVRKKPQESLPREIERESGGTKYEIVVKELQSQDSLKPVALLLHEIHKSSQLNKGLGRNSLLKRLQASNVQLSDHKIKHWLKILGQMGYIDSGVTRQGSKITKAGEELLEYIDNSISGVTR